MKPYVPSGKSDENGVVVLIAAALLAALAVGGLANVVGQFIRLLLVFPAAMGLGVGLVATRVTAARRIRAPGMVFGVAFLGGLLCWSTDFGLDYLRVRHQIRGQIETMVAELQDPGAVGEEAIDHCVDLTLVRWGRGEEMTTVDVAVNAYGESFTDDQGIEYGPEPVDSFLAPLLGHARNVASQGMTISNHGDKGVNIGATGTWILWALELLIAAGVAGFVAREQANQPFCERCGAWYDKKERLLPVAPAAASRAVAEAVQRGDPGTLIHARAPIDPKKAFVALSLRACPKCSSAPRFLAVAAIHQTGRKTTRKDGLKGLVDASSAEALVAALEVEPKG